MLLFGVIDLKSYQMERTLVQSTLKHIGKKVLLKGWVANHRAMGKMIFVDLRDRTGVIQCIALKETAGDWWTDLKSTTVESVIEISGLIKERDDSQKKGDLLGSLEIEVLDFKLLNKAAPLPIPVIGDGYDINEEARLKYRYLDLRRERLQSVIRLRSNLIGKVRESLANQDFVEIETPILTASTMEGSRDFVVPSRLNPGKFYALPQSPQQYKQLLMTGGYERYFQLARCIRDEDLRADRGFEHTQIDMEISFAAQEDILNIVENTVIESVEAVGGLIKQKPFPRIPYDEAMEKYGADKFDLRTGEDKENGVLAFAWVIQFPFFKKVDTEDAAEVRDGKSGWTFTHNPFSMPEEEHIEWHLKGENIGKIVTQQYDLVCNGFEVGGGSVRAHKPEVLRSTYKIMGYTDEEIEKSIGHMLKAFELGTPPHGGIALGLDRLVMLLAGEKSLKETIAFPMTYNGKTAVMEGPGPISDAQKKELGLNTSSQSVLEKVHSLIESNDVNFETHEHEPTPTSEDSARVRGTKMEEGIKALILKGKKTGKNILVAIPSHLKADMKAISDAAGDKFEFEKPEVIKERYGVIVGGVPPLGQVFDIPSYYDETIFEEEKSSFNAGTQENSVTMQSEDFKKVVEGNHFGKFSK